MFSSALISSTKSWCKYSPSEMWTDILAIAAAVPVLYPRKRRLCRTDSHCRKDNRRVSLYGLGDIGYVALTVIQFLLTNCRKTQVTPECAYRLRESHPDLPVFWVHASNAERFLQSYMALAFQCEISGRDDPKETLPIVKNWLENKDHGRWLMVIDNAMTCRCSFRAGADGLEQYIPECRHGSFLVNPLSNSPISGCFGAWKSPAAQCIAGCVAPRRRGQAGLRGLEPVRDMNGKRGVGCNVKTSHQHRDTAVVAAALWWACDKTKQEGRGACAG